MPTLPRRLNFAKGADEGPLSECPKARNECQTLKARTRSRCSTILKHTASFHAATTGLIARAVTKGGEHRWTFNPQENGNLPSIRDLPESFRQTGRPCSTGLTTLLTTASVCPSTRENLSSGNQAFGLRKSRNPLMALTPCASVLAMYSGMIGGFRDPTESGFVCNPDSSDTQGHWSLDQDGPGLSINGHRTLTGFRFQNNYIATWIAGPKTESLRGWPCFRSLWSYCWALCCTATWKLYLTGKFCREILRKKS